MLGTNGYEWTAHIAYHALLGTESFRHSSEPFTRAGFANGMLEDLQAAPPHGEQFQTFAHIEKNP